MLSEANRNNLLQAAVAAVVASLVMRHALKQSPAVADDRALVLGAAALAYLVAFGRRAPSMDGLNPSLRW